MANYTILLIDYEPRSIERFREPLVGAGYRIEIATDGVSGIEAFHRLNPDMVLVEAMIPKKHGFEVCQELKRTPHGRRTPVIITTGVYKGRKYRTQALHIYGCDEYIEKPIAAEQLLEIVGKFFAPGSAATASRAVEPAPAPVERTVERAPEPSGARRSRRLDGGDPGPEDRSRKTDPDSESSAAGDTEDEIMARLDAILPGGMFGEPQAEPSPVAMVATIEMPDELEACLPDEIPETFPAESPVELGAVAETGEDPFAQMRAELDAELGAFSAALALELEPIGDPFPTRFRRTRRLRRPSSRLSPSPKRKCDRARPRVGAHGASPRSPDRSSISTRSGRGRTRSPPRRRRNPNRRPFRFSRWRRRFLRRRFRRLRSLPHAPPSRR